MSHIPTRPSRGARACVALAVGLFSAAFTQYFLQRGPSEPDFAYWWGAAQLWNAGVDPYSVLDVYRANVPVPYDSPFPYPLPVVLAVSPLARFPMSMAASLFAGILGTTLAYAVTRMTWWPLIMCASAPYLVAIVDGQWSPLILTAALVPTAGALLWAKPTLGLAALVYARSWRGVAVAVIVGLLTLIAMPSWPLEWIRTASLRAGDHMTAVGAPLGPALLLGLLRWRRREARLLVVLACLPQLLMFYDQLLLWAIPRTAREMLVLTLASNVGLLAAVLSLHPGDFFTTGTIPWIVPSCYLPALLLVLRHPNAGAIPAWMESRLALLVARWPRLRVLAGTAHEPTPAERR